MRVKKVNRFVPEQPIRMGSTAAWKAEAAARPKPKHIEKLERHATKPRDMAVRLRKR